MSWFVIVDKKVKKDTEKFPSKDRDLILTIVEELSNDPYHGDIEKMRGEENVWRRRVGSYRIFYEAFLEKRIVHVFRIERRTSKTY